MSKKTIEDFIKEARGVHGYKYSYDKSDYINSHVKMCITCPEHGEFWQTPTNHLQGKGCPKCAELRYIEKKSSNTEEFIEKARKVHGDKYIYDKSIYVNARTPLTITCRVHGDFQQTPDCHLRGRGCPECGRISQWDKRGRITTEKFIEDAREVHSDKYDYSKVKYINAQTKVCIICPNHGEFWQKTSGHLQGCGCPKCNNEKLSKDKTDTQQAFLDKAIKVHNRKYDYSDVDYTGSTTKVLIICPKHGGFYQRPSDHIQGKGCPKCGIQQSKAEEEINDFINQECKIGSKARDRSLLAKRLECDILIPSHNLAIEFDGMIWHSERFGKSKNYHLTKTQLAESKGYHLIHIFEDEWLEHKDIVLNKIRHFLGKDTDRPVIGARKCTIKKVSKAEAESFLNTYHIQGYVPSTAYYGAFYEDKLIGVMTFKQEKPNEWNLTRFSTDTSYRLPGLASKIFKQFVKDYNPIEVKTFLDRRWSHGDVNVYDRMGFKLTKTLPPDYRYVVGNQRIHKFNFRKHILNKKYGLPLSMTEKEMTEKLGFYRIWDCGLYKYVWRKQSEDSH